MPAKNVLMVNAMSLYFAVLMPIILASASLPWMARNAKPMRDFIMPYMTPMDTTVKEMTRM